MTKNTKCTDWQATKLPPTMNTTNQKRQEGKKCNINGAEHTRIRWTQSSKQRLEKDYKGHWQFDGKCCSTCLYKILLQVPNSVKVGWNACALQVFHLGRMYRVNVMLKKQNAQCSKQEKGNIIIHLYYSICVNSWHQ